MQKMLYINDSCTDPYWNLAAEEYLLAEFSQPVFRLWQNSSSIIIGHYQNALAEIETNHVRQHNIKVVRRLTGGGAVFHDLGNVNYTFIEKRRKGEDSSAMFQRFTAPIIAAMNAIGVKASLQGRNDLVIDNRKISGNAVCIHKDRILQHGTLLFSASMENLSAALKSRPEKFKGKAVQSNRSRVTNISEHIPAGYCNTIKDINSFKEHLANFILQQYPQFVPYNYTKEDLEAIARLKEEKYSQYWWNFGTSPAYSYSKVEKFEGGIVEMYLNVSAGKIEALEIRGDYFFTLPTEEFCAQLIGTPHTPYHINGKIAQIHNSIQSAGNPLGLSAYFNNIGPDEISGMFFNNL